MRRSGLEDVIELILGITGIIGCGIAVAWVAEWVTELVR